MYTQEISEKANKPVITLIRAGAIASLVLAVMAAPGFAQTTETESSAEAETSQQAEQPSQVKSNAAVSEKSTPAKPTKIRAQSAQSADNYEASEEISEDLSVSYPVDI
ncbi:hypothetical protein [Microbulbifer mangrovi]|uniref:hypothetical protein n=1 Tax=Microbulbifer mangrovi TaxID=927787 RepID=UPI0009907AE9|nr:hypothetical protein [Microbulbifer mangrovi]